MRQIQRRMIAITEKSVKAGRAVQVDIRLTPVLKELGFIFLKVQCFQDIALSNLNPGFCELAPPPTLRRRRCAVVVRRGQHRRRKRAHLDLCLPRRSLTRERRLVDWENVPSSTGRTFSRVVRVTGCVGRVRRGGDGGAARRWLCRRRRRHRIARRFRPTRQQHL